MSKLGTDSEATYKEVGNGFPKAMDCLATYKKSGSVLPTLPINKVICGDCLEVMKKFPDECVDLILTDPPFKVSQMYGGGTDADNLINVASILRTIPEMSRIIKNGRFVAMFYDNRILPFLFEAVKGTDLIYRRSLFLYRRWGNANRWMGWMQCTDPICLFVKGHTIPFHAEVKGKVKHDCYIKRTRESVNTRHCAQKPMNILRDIIFWCSNKNEIVLDPYCGSGTTLIASQQLDRKWIGIDVNREYVVLSKRNIENTTFAKLGIT